MDFLLTPYPNQVACLPIIEGFGGGQIDHTETVN
jgi:hypothetical protein